MLRLRQKGFMRNELFLCIPWCTSGFRRQTYSTKNKCFSDFEIPSPFKKAGLKTSLDWRSICSCTPPLRKGNLAFQNDDSAALKAQVRSIQGHYHMQIRQAVILHHVLFQFGGQKKHQFAYMNNLSRRILPRWKTSSKTGNLAKEQQYQSIQNGRTVLMI